LLTDPFSTSSDPVLSSTPVGSLKLHKRLT
jgi:hypothetical protein